MASNRPLPSRLFRARRTILADVPWRSEYVAGVNLWWPKLVFRSSQRPSIKSNMSHVPIQEAICRV